ncbi:MAG: S9 family peptidase [Bacteroidetes bacterium]|nr:MAG: S9 family peptidase [Bacteroidota bacterium]
MSQLPPLIPRDVLFGNPERMSPQISPDGKWLAYIAPLNGVLNVWLRTVGKNDDRAITRDSHRGIRSYFWSEDSQHIIYEQDKDGDENWHLYLVNCETEVVKDLTPHSEIHAQVIHTDPNIPDRILVGLNVRDKRLHDVYEINLYTGAETLLEENPGNVVGWIADNSFTIRAAIAQEPDGGHSLLVRHGAAKEWQSLVKWSFEDGFPNVYGFTHDNSAMYLGDPREWNATRLVELALNGNLRVIAQDEVYDLGHVVTHPTGHYVQLVSFYKHRNIWGVIDKGVAEDWTVIERIDDGDALLISRTKEDEVWIVAFVKDDGPVKYYMFKREDKSVTYLFSNRPVLEQYLLTEMKPVAITARDGMTLHGYLTLPGGIEAKYLPMVLNVHGGPWARDTWGLNPEAQWFANRGYACLQVNFRGSTGYGKKFLNAGDREWGAKMHDDLIDAVQWAVREGIADAKRIAIYGGSYGGYAALAGAAFTPDVFTCSVDIVGPSSLITLINSIPPYWEPVKVQFTKRVGDPETESEFLKSRSPLFFADKIKIPMLIAQGANDPRVKQAESEQIVDALKKNGKEVEYMLFPDEGHGFARPENRLNFYAVAEKFLAKYLGGRSE